MIDSAIITAVANALVAGTPSAWHLADISTLGGPAKTDPLAASASQAFMKTETGRTLTADLKKLFVKPARIGVELFVNKADFLQRRAKLTNTSGDPNEGEGVKGHTVLLVPGGASPAEEAAEVMTRANFIVLACLPADSKTRTVISEEDWVIVSEPFRRMRLAITLFHELLHVWWARKKTNPAEDLVFGNPGEQPYFIDLGHGDDTAFDINTQTLELETEGSIAPEFRRLLSAFVKEVVEKNKFKDAIAEQRRIYRARPQP